jgi:uncharacterized membrane protein YphA (DoxX/SURF4 family)
MHRQFPERLDRIISDTLWRIGVPLLRVALGIVFVWFGTLKLTGASPALEVVTRTVYWFDPSVFVPVLGWWEVAIGVCLAIPSLTRIGIFLLAAQFPGTFLPLVLLPEVCFQDHWWNLTLEGQYIVKNLIILGSAFVLGGLVHGSRQPD